MSPKKIETTPIEPTLIARLTLKKIVLEELRSYVSRLDDYEIMQLFFNGTVWISRHDVENNVVNAHSFQRLGEKFDGITRQYSSECECIADMDGMPEGYRLELELAAAGEESEDDDESCFLPILTIGEARQLIVSILNEELDDRFDTVLMAVNDTKYTS